MLASRATLLCGPKVVSRPRGGDEVRLNPGDLSHTRETASSRGQGEAGVKQDLEVGRQMQWGDGSPQLLSVRSSQEGAVSGSSFKLLVWFSSRHWSVFVWKLLCVFDIKIPWSLRWIVTVHFTDERN